MSRKATPPLLSGRRRRYLPDLLRYGAARIARVYPVYLLSLAVVAPFILADGSPAKTPLVAAHGLLLQGWLGHIPVSWNTPAWSLSCEFFFYLCFPMLTFLLRRSSKLKLSAAALAGMAVPVVLARFGLPAAWKPAASPPASRSTP